MIADIAFRNGYSDVRFVDDVLTGDVMGIPVVDSLVHIERLNDGRTDFVLGIGENDVRRQIAQAHDVPWATLIHPSAQISMNVTFGKGTVVMANAVINACASVGRHCIVNSGAIVEHDNVIEDYVHLSPRVALGGTVRVGALTHIGIGATVSNNVRICENSIIGAGAVVVKNIERSGTYVGIPARRI